MEGDGASATTIRKAKATLSALFATAVEDRKVRHNPVLGVRYVPQVAQPRARKRPMTVEELGRLLEAIPARHRLLFELMAQTGLRIGEVLGLTRESVDLGDHPRLRVREQIYRGKRKKLKSANAVRDVPLSTGMARRLPDVLAAAADRRPEAPLFQSQTGGPLDYSGLYNRVFRAARKAAGLEWVTFHTFRHTCGSLLHEARKTDRQLCDWLGHADPAFTVRTYVGTLDDGLGDADFMDGLVGNARATGGQRNPHE